MKRSHRVRGQNIRLVASDLHRHGRGTREQRGEEDLVLHHHVGTRGRLPRGVSGRAVAGARGGGGEPIPEVELLFRDAGLAGLVGLDVVGEEIAPVVVGHVGYVALGAVGDPVFFDGADVVGFAVVIPGKNL